MYYTSVSTQEKRVNVAVDETTFQHDSSKHKKNFSSKRSLYKKKHPVQTVTIPGRRQITSIVSVSPLSLTRGPVENFTFFSPKIGSRRWLNRLDNTHWLITFTFRLISRLAAEEAHLSLELGPSQKLHKHHFDLHFTFFFFSTLFSRTKYRFFLWDFMQISLITTHAIDRLLKISLNNYHIAHATCEQANIHKQSKLRDLVEGWLLTALSHLISSPDEKVNTRDHARRKQREQKGS